MAIRPRPLRDRIVVKRDSPEETTKGGIILPGKAQKDSRTGVVVYAGPGMLTADGKTIKNSLKPGDKIVFGTYAGSEIEFNGEKFQVMRENDVSMVLEEVDDETIATEYEVLQKSGTTPVSTTTSPSVEGASPFYQ